ncbi:MAG: methyltransferase, partial [Lachnospiraceae bacterium]|nr:methyltransferase [Lachnospiraceae bacterium]
GASYPFRVFLMKDQVTIGLDTTGESLHKRGYRKLVSKAPIAENWNNLLARKLWYRGVDEANDLLDLNVHTDIQGYDIDGEIVGSARDNAARAGVEKLIHFQQRPVAQLSHPKKYGFIITNPPYGERIGEREQLGELYTQLAQRYKALDAWSLFVITGFADVEKYIGRKADKNRKIYNGMMKTYLYQFLGPKPPKRSAGQERS